ncbi:MAG: ribonuclease H family protein [Bacteroidales bacterium]|nr:ribonuclease H family protein [Bacteroidales bacterium]
MAKKQKFYVVWKGVEPGVYSNWDECKKNIEGFEGAIYRSFETLAMAEEAITKNPNSYRKKTEAAGDQRVGSPIKPSLSVDAACSGNPGVMEYQGVDTHTKQLIFHLGPFPEGTVNLGEFLALVHGLAYLKKNKLDYPIYTDSRTAMAWVRNKKIKTTLERNDINADLFQLVDRAVDWIQSNSYTTKIHKWETKVWGEIPADFGRK